MTTPMRWADSDSDDSDDEYNVNEESSEASKSEEAPISSDNQQNQATVSHTIPSVSSRDNYKGKHKNDDKNQWQHQQNTQQPKNHQKGGNGGSYGGGGNNRAHHPQHSHNKNRGGTGPENWKQLAKASSRFSSGNSDSSANIDGSAWMAQRKAKMEQEAKEQNKKEAERLQQEQEQKQSRRKSQLSALKAAMCEIKQKQVQEVSQKAGSTSSGVVDMPSSNVRILKKNAATAATVTATSRFDGENSISQGQASSKSGKPQNDPKNCNQKVNMTSKGSWRRSKASSSPSLTASTTPSHSTQPSPPPKYSYTIGQAPSIISKQKQQSLHKTELQPDRSSVKFTRQQSGSTGNKINTVSDAKLSNQCDVEAKGQETKGRVAISTHHKEQITCDSTDTNNGDSNRGDKGKKIPTRNRCI